MRYEVWRALINGGQAITTGVAVFHGLELEPEPVLFDSEEDVKVHLSEYFRHEGKVGGFVRIKNTDAGMVIEKLGVDSWNQSSGDISFP